MALLGKRGMAMTDVMWQRIAITLIGGGLVVIAGACGGGNEKAASGGSTSTATPATPGSTATAPSSTAAPVGAPAGTTAAATAAPSASSITPQMVALGDSIFHGKVAGGLCYTCHGADAKGTQLAPPLVAPKKWLTGDGSYQFIVQRVTTGMPNPTPPYPGPMLPKGGDPNMTQAQVNAVAAYVYSISHPGAVKK